MMTNDRKKAPPRRETGPINTQRGSFSGGRRGAKPMFIKQHGIEWEWEGGRQSPLRVVTALMGGGTGRHASIPNVYSFPRIRTCAHSAYIPPPHFLLPSPAGGGRDGGGTISSTHHGNAIDAPRPRCRTHVGGKCVEAVWVREWRRHDRGRKEMIGYGKERKGGERGAPEISEISLHPGAACGKKEYLRVRACVCMRRADWMFGWW